MKINISRLTSSDKELFLKFIKRQNIEDHFLFTRWKDSINSNERLDSIVNSECNLLEKNGFRLIAKNQDGVICGYGLIDFFSQQEKKHVSIVGTIVDKEFRNQGIGTQLLKEEIQLSKLHNKLKIRASAHEHNIPSIRLHESLGFTNEGVFVAEEFKEKYLNVVSMALFLETDFLK